MVFLQIELYFFLACAILNLDICNWHCFEEEFPLETILPRSLLEAALLLLCALCTASETALKELAGKGYGREEDSVLADLVREPTNALAALRVSMMAGFFAAAATVGAWFRLPFGWAKARPALGEALVLALFCFLYLLLVSFFPRRLAMHRPEAVGNALWSFTRALDVVLRPIVLVLSGLNWLLLRLVKIDPAAEQEGVSEEDIRMMVDMSQEKGAIEKEEKELIENVFEFNNSTAGDVMIHRTDVVMLWVDDPAEEIVETIRSSGLTRYPVYEEDQDDVIGILNTRDYLLNATGQDPRPLRQLLRKAYFVPESVRTDLLFRDMQSKKIHLAVVVDEYGGTSGIVTMEDLIEELVGNIYDEFDPLEDLEIIPMGENLWRVAGGVPLEELGQALEIAFPEDEEAETLGGLVFEKLDVIPEDGSRPVVEADGLRVQVEELSERRVEWARVSKILPEEAQKAGDGEN